MEDGKVCYFLSFAYKKESGLTRVDKVTGTLKGYDALMNLVLDEVQESLRGMFLHVCYLDPPSILFYYGIYSYMYTDTNEK
jgi:LSM domain